jgi:predicted CXXCH cytochrome family protein
MSRIGILALAAALALSAPLRAAAVESPHDASKGYSCQNCHIGHSSVGGGLTNNSVNSALCASCHDLQPNFNFPWPSSMQAQAGTSGTSHSWSALASNLGATIPDPGSANTTERSLGQHLDAGNKLKCSTCHDVHQASGVGGTIRSSVPLGTNVACTAACPGTPGTLQLTATPAGAKAAGYVIQISAAGAQFKISHDNGKSYFGWSGSAWAAGLPNGKPFTSGTAVTLDDNLTTITLTGNATSLPVGMTFAGFYVSYPFLRAKKEDLCVACHKDRNQSSRNVEGLGPHKGTGAATVPGTTVFSHPVGEALGAAYDRTTILDADGSTTTDGNPSNDLVLGTGGVVNCTTCHHLHNADSNSLSVDPR